MPVEYPGTTGQTLRKSARNRRLDGVQAAAADGTCLLPRARRTNKLCSCRVRHASPPGRRARAITASCSAPRYPAVRMTERRRPGVRYRHQASGCGRSLGAAPPSLSGARPGVVRSADRGMVCHGLVLLAVGQADALVAGCLAVVTESIGVPTRRSCRTALAGAAAAHAARLAVIIAGAGQHGGRQRRQRCYGVDEQQGERQRSPTARSSSRHHPRTGGESAHSVDATSAARTTQVDRVPTHLGVVPDGAGVG